MFDSMNAEEQANTSVLALASTSLVPADASLEDPRRSSSPSTLREPECAIDARPFTFRRLDMVRLGWAAQRGTKAPRVGPPGRCRAAPRSPAGIRAARPAIGSAARVLGRPALRVSARGMAREADPRAAPPRLAAGGLLAAAPAAACRAPPRPLGERVSKSPTRQARLRVCARGVCSSIGRAGREQWCGHQSMQCNRYGP